MIESYNHIHPSIGKHVFVHASAAVNGDVTLGDYVTIWFNASLRGDTGQIIIGANSNVQDNSCLHNTANIPLVIGEFVTVGHGAILHSCSIGDNTLIGMGAIILDDAKIGRNCLIGAGALITPGTIIPDNSLVLGSPGKVVKSLSKEQIEKQIANAKHYVEMGASYLKALKQHPM